MGLEEAQAIYDATVAQADIDFETEAQAAMLAHEQAVRAEIEEQLAMAEEIHDAEQARIYETVTAVPRQARQAKRVEALRIFNETKGVSAE